MLIMCEWKVRDTREIPSTVDFPSVSPSRKRVCALENHQTGKGVSMKFKPKIVMKTIENPPSVFPDLWGRLSSMSDADLLACALDLDKIASQMRVCVHLRRAADSAHVNEPLLPLSLGKWAHQ